ncbi:MAG: Uma2 family endonuclease [Nodosilinea sp.]
MSQHKTGPMLWTAADLELFPDNGNRYEIVDGELLVTKAPDWRHQRTSTRISTALDVWSLETGLGEVVQAPGVIFSDADNVIPDVVWVSRERLPLLINDSGHLTGAPDLAVEVLSVVLENERRDRQLKLKLYSERGVQEYWIVDWQKQQVEIYRREQGRLRLMGTRLAQDQLTSPLLPGFSHPLMRIFG